MQRSVSFRRQFPPRSLNCEHSPRPIGSRIRTAHLEARKVLQPNMYTSVYCITPQQIKYGTFKHVDSWQIFVNKAIF